MAQQFLVDGAPQLELRNCPPGIAGLQYYREHSVCVRTKGTVGVSLSGPPFSATQFLLAFLFNNMHCDSMFWYAGPTKPIQVRFRVTYMRSLNSALKMEIPSPTLAEVFDKNLRFTLHRFKHKALGVFIGSDCHCVKINCLVGYRAPQARLRRGASTIIRYWYTFIVVCSLSALTLLIVYPTSAVVAFLLYANYDPKTTYTGFDEVYALWALSSVSKGGLEWSSQQLGQVGSKYTSSLLPSSVPCKARCFRLC